MIPTDAGASQPRVSWRDMKLGFSLPTAGAWATPENQIRIAREAEALGYH